MSPDAFRETVLPEVVLSWESGCFCSQRGFRKLVSFDYRDYGIRPTGLADSEILIQSLIRDRFERVGEPQESPGVIFQRYRCPQCGATCQEEFSEFSISMYRSVVVFAEQPKPAAAGLYLIGFYGFKSDDFDQVTDFEKAESQEAFVAQWAQD